MMDSIVSITEVDGNPDHKDELCWSLLPFKVIPYFMVHTDTGYHIEVQDLRCTGDHIDI